MAVDKSGVKAALDRIENAINEALKALGAHEPVNRDELIKNFQIRDFLVEAMKY
jgi:hypothetical protein